MQVGLLFLIYTLRAPYNSYDAYDAKLINYTTGLVYDQSRDKALIVVPSTPLTLPSIESSVACPKQGPLEAAACNTF